MRNITSRNSVQINTETRTLTENTPAFLQIEKLNRLMSISSSVNKTIVRVKDKNKLLQNVCSIFTETGKYKAAAALSFYKRSGNIQDKFSVSLCYSGEVLKTLPLVDIDTLNRDYAEFKHGNFFICGDINLITNGKIKNRLKEKGIRSAGFFPIYERNKIAAALVLFSDNYNVFDNDELNAINEAIEDISFALEVIQKEEELQKLSKSLENSTTTVLITDIDGNIEYVNARFSEISGYSAEEVLGKNPRILNAGAMKAEIYEELWKTIKSGHIWRGELLNRRKTGELYWISMSISPLFDSRGKIINYISVREDISDKMRMMNELMQAKLSAEKSDRLKEEFLAQMSHEVRTPINAILSFSELIKDELENIVSDDLRESFCIIDRAGKRITRTIDLILNMSQISSGSYECHYRALDIYKEVIGSIYHEFKLAAEEKGLSFKIINNYDSSLVYGDEYSISQLLINLLDNAVKFTDKGEIEVSINQTQKEILIDIKDTGIGISDEYQQNLFKPFLQEEQGYTRHFEGNGLGLALAKKYCEINNASIEVLSQKGKGPTFRLRFPLI